jgi:guanine deaminase
MSGENYKEAFMQRAIQLSEMAFRSGKGLPIGCVIVKDNVIVGEGHNEIFLRNNPTAHAEMVAIERACKNIASLQLEGCELYTSLEPCPMCFGAIYWAGLKTVYFAGTNADAAGAGFADACIGSEFVKPAGEQQIPMLHKAHAVALEVLNDWKNMNPDTRQI